MSHPYRNKPHYCFWSKSVTWCPPGQLDPVTQSTLKIGPNTKVATLGSCFAQHIARHLASSGLTYFVTETAPSDMADEEAKSKNYSVFSARYGNVYTPKQAVQLIQRAFEQLKPEHRAWRHKGKLVDPFRPTIEPGGFETEEELIAAREVHLSAVRRMVREADVIVFTLGLTEGWRSKADGSVFPLAPGVAGGEFNDVEFEPVNYSIEDTIADLREFIALIKNENAAATILLTVSPVPLIATHENRHVLVSTTVSKSILRAAADSVEREFDNVIYFPSYEIVTSHHANYFEDDLRSVSSLGVAHVMRVFEKHYVSGGGRVESGHMTAAIQPADDVVCDEEEIEATLAHGAAAR